MPTNFSLQLISRRVHSENILGDLQRITRPPVLTIWLSCPCTRNEGEEGGGEGIVPFAWHWREVSGQPHAPAALPPTLDKH